MLTSSSLQCNVVLGNKSGELWTSFVLESCFGDTGTNDATDSLSFSIFDMDAMPKCLLFCKAEI